MTQLVELLGPTAPYGAAIVIVVLCGAVISTEIRRHRAEKRHQAQAQHSQEMERENQALRRKKEEQERQHQRESHDLEKRVLNAQLQQLSAQDSTYEALQREVEEASEQAYKGGRKAAERNEIEKWLQHARDDLDRRRQENARVREAVGAFMGGEVFISGPDGDDDLQAQIFDDLQTELKDSEARVAAAEYEVARVLSRVRHPSRQDLWDLLPEQPRDSA